MRAPFTGALLTWALCLSSVTSAAPSSAPPRPALVVDSALATADDAFSQMWVSHPYASTHAQEGRVQTGVELHRYHIGELAALARGQHPLVPALPPGAQLKKVFAYYGFGSQELVDAVLDAKRSGIQIEITTDLNRSLHGQFKAASWSTDFQNARIDNSETGKALARLLENGFEIAPAQSSPVAQTHAYRIFSQPLFDEKVIQMIPIFHLKESFTVQVSADGSEIPLYMTFGTANMNENVPRFNRMFVITDPDLVRHAYAHYKVMTATFEKGGSIRDVPPMDPLQVRYRDGTTLQLGYTDGQFDLHAWHIDKLDQAIASPEQIRVLNHMMSNFVVTNGNFLSTLQKALETFPEMNLTGVVDQKFLNDRAWGLSRLLQGMFAYRPMGKPVPGFSFAARMRKTAARAHPWENRIRIQGWVRAVPGKAVADLDGAPYAIEVWHDKTRVTRVELRPASPGALPERRAWLSTGSFNESKNIQNMESLLFGEFSNQSWVVDAIEESVREVAKNSPHKAIPGNTVYFLDDLGRFLGVGFYSLKQEQAQDVLSLLREYRLTEARGYLLALGRNKTDLTEKLYFESLTTRVDRLIALLEWLRTKTTEKGYLNRVNERTLPSLLRLLSDPDLHGASARHILSRLVWNLSESKTLSRAALTAQADADLSAAWQLLKLEQDLHWSATTKKTSVPKNPQAGLKRLRVEIHHRSGMLLAQAEGEPELLDPDLRSLDRLQSTPDTVELWIASVLLQVADFAADHPERGQPRVTLIDEDEQSVALFLRTIAQQIALSGASPFRNINVFARRKLPSGHITDYRILRSGDAVFTESLEDPETSASSALAVTPLDIAQGKKSELTAEQRKELLQATCLDLLRKK